MSPALRNNLVVLALVIGVGLDSCRRAREAEGWEARARAHAVEYVSRLYDAPATLLRCDRATTTIWSCELKVDGRPVLAECDGASEMCEVRP